MPDKTVECPSCALEIDAREETCPYCGYELPQERPIWRIVAVVVVLLLIWPLVELLRLLF